MKIKFLKFWPVMNKVDRFCSSVVPRTGKNNDFFFWNMNSFLKKLINIFIYVSLKPRIHLSTNGGTLHCTMAM